MAVSKRTRFEVLRRDNHACRYCGATAPDAKLQVDHVTPIALGGTDTPDNLVAACIDCNYGKSSSSPDANHVADVNADAVRWAAAMKQAVKVMEKRAEERDDRLMMIYQYFTDGTWSRWVYGPNNDPIPLPDDWEETFARFMDYGIDAGQLEAWLDETIRGRRVNPENIFRYVCGIAWKRIREFQDIAKQLIEEEDATS